jgi:type IV pilus assembly protein PilX
MRCNPKFARPQQGAILIVSLLLLLVMTVLALTASQTTRLQERMAGNARDLDMAFQAGEAGLRAAEMRLETDVPKRFGDRIRCPGQSVQNCDMAERWTTATFEFDERNIQWWTDNARQMPDALADIEVTPHFYTEERARVRDSLVKKGTNESGTIYYLNTSRSQGATPTAVTMIESTYAVRY